MTITIIEKAQGRQGKPQDFVFVVGVDVQAIFTVIFGDTANASPHDLFEQD